MAIEESRAPRGDSRNRMIETTVRLLQRQGYHGTGLNQIVAEARAPKGSMYHHFPGGKEQLAAEAVEADGRAVARLMEAATTAQAAAEILIDLLLDQLIGSGFADGCAIATTALELGPASERISDAAATAFADWERVIAERLEAEGGDAGPAAEAATLTVAAIEGATPLSKARRAPEPLQAVRRVLPVLLSGAA
jgi:TetR/AcrR family transcriptional repressor of lmrAB and yxaGH operons